MKGVFILIVFPLSLLGQTWTYLRVGNSFDGFGRLAGVQSVEKNEESFALAVINNAETFVLREAINTKDGINNLSIRLSLNDNILVNRVLMAFDDMPTYYVLNASISNKILFINNAVTPDYKSFLSKIDIVNYFKKRRKVTFRLYANDSNIDVSFSLSGCSAALSKVFSCPTYRKRNDWTDAALELLVFQKMFIDADDGKRNVFNLSFTCNKYFEKEYGAYFFTQVKSIHTKSNLTFPDLLFKNSFDDIIAEVSSDIYLVNYFHYSGNPKLDGNNKLSKDLETIELYYNAFLDKTNLIPKYNITFEAFSNLSKNQLVEYFNAAKLNKSLLDYLRQNIITNYFYEPDEYTFDVFLEAWGL